MKTKKHVFTITVAVLLLGALVYLQFRTWRHFEWHKLAQTVSYLWNVRSIACLLLAIGAVHFVCWLRALRWKIFLRPVRSVPLRRLVAPQFIGFAALALLGRPGEVVRPYLIARNEALSVSSQVAVWTVERMFDIAAFTVLLCLDTLAFGQMLPHSELLPRLGWLLTGLVLVMAVGAVLVRRSGAAIADRLEPQLARISPRFAACIGNSLRQFGIGLNAVVDVASFLKAAAVSLAIWVTIALVFRLVLYAYPQPPLQRLHLPEAVLLIASSMAGSLIQIPAVGGGTQLAVIAMLSSPEWFSVPRELAVSAGILIWLVTFMALIPAGVALARRERLSIFRLSAKAESVRPAVSGAASR